MALEPGTRLGPYEILSPIGAGGMGEVYRARDSKLRRDVAIKVLPEAFASSPEAYARFEREALAIAALSHPNILSIFDFGTETGTTYAVMELLEGETLRKKLEAGPIDPRQAVDFAVQMAKGLAAAHEGGVVHRDLKPENLFVSKDGHLKILDFGLAKRQAWGGSNSDTSAPTETARTEPGTVMGTVGYMAPEQVRGLVVDHRADIFAFGTILYEMLTGKRAFRRDTAADTLTAIMRDQPPEMSQSGRNIPPALDHVVRHCLEKEADQRFQSARDIQFALSEASGATPITGVRTARSFKVPWKVLLGAGLAVLVAVAGVWLARRSTRSGLGSSPASVKRIAVLPFENQGSPEDDYLADGIADEIRGKLTALPQVEVIARGSSTPYRKTTKTPKQIAEELHAAYLVTATVRWDKSGASSRVHVSPELVDVTHPDAPISRWQQPFDAPLTNVFEVQSSIAGSVARALGVVLGAGQEQRLAEMPTHNLAAYDAFLKGEAVSKNGSASDLPTVREALESYDQAVALDPAFAEAWARVSWANTNLHGFVPTSGTAERAREAGEKAIALAPGKIDGYLALGRFENVVLYDYRRALELYGKARRIEEGNAELLSATGAVEEHLGQWGPAMEQFQRAERLDPRSSSSWSQHGAGLLRLRRYVEAREVIDRGLALAPGNLGLIEARAMTFVGEGDLPRARAVLRSVPAEVSPTGLVALVAERWDLVWLLDDPERDVLLRLTPGAFGDDRGDWALSLTQAYALRGDAANRIRLAEEARQAIEEQLRATPDDAQQRALHGIALAYLGRKEEAVHEGERATALLPVGKDALTGAYLKHLLARTYVLAGEPEKAIDQLDQLLRIPYFVSPGWLKIDPNFDPLRGNPRFRKLVASA